MAWEFRKKIKMSKVKAENRQVIIYKLCLYDTRKTDIKSLREI